MSSTQQAPEATPEPPIARSRALGIVASSGAAAVCSFLITVVSTNSLGSEELALEFLVFWALLFGAYGVISGIQNETTRATSAVWLAEHAPTGAGRPVTRGAPVLAGAAVMGGAAAALVGASAWWWAPRFVPHVGWAPALLVGAVFLYAFHVALSGALAGQRSWGLFALVMGAEAVLRLVTVALAAWFAPGNLTALAWATIGPAAMWLVFVALSRDSRRAAASVADVGLGQLVRNNVVTALSAAATAVLITGFPAVLKGLAGGGQQAAALAALILAISLTRSPLMIPLQAFQGVAVTAFLAAPGRRLAVLARYMGALAALGAVAAVAAALLGPWLLGLLYPALGYELPGETFAGLMLAAVAITWLTLSGMAALAINAHRTYLAGWVVASAASVALLWLPLPLEPRVVVALLAGPLLGWGVHLEAIARADRAQRPTL